MKILFLIETLGNGGAERVLVNTLPELKKLGIICEVAILFKRDDLAVELEEHGQEQAHHDKFCERGIPQKLDRLPDGRSPLSRPSPRRRMGQAEAISPTDYRIDRGQ